MAVVMFAMVLPVMGQDDTKDDLTKDAPRKDARWACNVTDGSYLVALNRITSISRHRYVLDAAVVVDELVVDTSGHSLVRFYFISPVTDEMRGSGLATSASRLMERSKEVLNQGAERAGTRLQEMVQKTYPHTTHANQVEFRVQSAAALGAIQASVTNSWETGRGRTITVNE